MRLKSLHIAGFKSFCHPVKIEFQQKGITIIVGPNGCGKSNVVDAMRWVLGEQSAKHLRGGGMEDVIFAGSEYHKPLGVAEVTLTFNNQEGNTLPKYQDFAEISVSRRLYRSGESLYLINKNPVRLMDVRELFMDTGIGGKSYAIIEQGKVGEIVSARPSDRRVLVEEAAGIVKFKTKRQTAEKRMEATEQNLLRVEDILQELARQEELLRDQVEKANAYLEIKEESQKLDQQLSTFRWQKALKKEKNAEGSTAQFKERQTELLKNRAIAEKHLENLSADLAKQNLELENLREKGFHRETQIQEAKNRRALEEQNLRNYEERIEQHDQELDDLRTRLGETQEQLQEGEQTTQALEKQHAQLQAEVTDTENSRQEESDILHDLNEEVHDFQKRLLTIHTQLTNHTNQKGFLEDRLNNLDEREYRIEEQARANTELLGQALAKVSKTKAQIERINAAQTAIRQRFAKFEAALREEEATLVQLESEVQDAQYEYTAALSRVDSLKKIQDQFEDFDESVKSFMDHLKAHPEVKEQFGIVGVLAEFISIDPEILPKVAPALVDYLDLFLLGTIQVLPELENFCQSLDIGRLGFIALDQPIRIAPEDVPSQGTPLSQLVQLSGPATSLAQGIFNQIYLIDSEESWQGLFVGGVGRSGVEWISPAGSYYTKQGIAEIGTPRQTSFGFLERKTQIEQLEQDTVTYKATVEGLQAQQTQLKEQHAASIQNLEGEKAKQHESELEMSRYQKELEHDQLEHRRAEQLQSQLQADRTQLQEEVDKARQKLLEIEESFLLLGEERQELEEQMEHHQESILVQRRLVEEVSEKLLSTRVAFTETFEQFKNKQREVQRLKEEHDQGQKRLRGLDNSENELKQKIEKSKHEIAQIDGSFEELLIERETVQDQLTSSTELHKEMTGKRTESSQALQETAQELDQLLTKIHEESLRTTEQRMQREQIEQQLTNTYGRSPQEMLGEVNLEEVNESQIASRLKRLRVKLNEMSNVNLGAPEEYAALEERMQFMGQQSTDLQAAIDDLRASIREINNESLRRFQETFTLINDYFKKIFTDLFEGGEARMILTDPENPLDSGVEIIAQPPGKKLQNLNLLSGGEKALTAISLIFAIFLLKPSPFCLLDEVDAPLDDVNVGRFNGMIQKMTSNSQFIVITHNKKTMEIGELMYGVTMEEPGISKTVSVKFQEAAVLTA